MLVLIHLNVSLYTHRKLCLPQSTYELKTSAFSASPLRISAKKTLFSRIAFFSFLRVLLHIYIGVWYAMILLGECTTQVSGGRIIEIVRIPGLLEIVCGGEKN